MKLLDGNYDCGPDFAGSDTKKLFKINLRSQPLDWMWRVKPVHYTLNEQNYRCPNWQVCDWNNSIIIFGCSLVFGVGVNDNETLPENLSKIINFPIVNLGQPGTGINFIWANSVILQSYNIKPKACIFVWPDMSRQTEFLSEFKTEHHGSWNVKDSKFVNLITNDIHNRFYFQYMVKTIKLIWQCPIIECTYYSHISEILDCQMLDFIDRARDIKHPGPETTKLAAEIIAKRVNNIG